METELKFNASLVNDAQNFLFERVYVELMS